MAKSNPRASLRPQVTGVTVNVLNPDGTTRTYTIDPTQSSGLFWDDLTVREMLAAWYKVHPQTKTREELTHALGERIAGLLLGKRAKVTLTDVEINALWDLQEDGKLLIGFLGKLKWNPPHCPEHC
jgi:hypothetical protein